MAEKPKEWVIEGPVSEMIQVLERLSKKVQKIDDRVMVAIEVSVTNEDLRQALQGTDEDPKETSIKKPIESINTPSINKKASGKRSAAQRSSQKDQTSSSSAGLPSASINKSGKKGGGHE